MNSETVFRFNNIDCQLVKSNYQKRGSQEARLALQVVSAETPHNEQQNISPGSPVATASINVLTEPLKANEAVIKDYYENEGLLGALVKAKLVKRTGRSVPTGMVLSEIVICLI